MISQPTEQDLQSILYQALSSGLGLVLRTAPSTRDLLRQRLYAARRGAKDPDLSCLQFRAGALPEELWIVKGQEKEEIP